MTSCASSSNRPWQSCRPNCRTFALSLHAVSELLDEARGADTLDPRFAGLANLVVGLMDVEIRALQLVDALACHLLA